MSTGVVVMHSAFGSHPRLGRGPCSAVSGRTTSAAKRALRDVSQLTRKK